jgi:hypothetical protein
MSNHICPVFHRMLATCSRPAGIFYLRLNSSLKERYMRLDLAGKRARKLISDYQLTEDEIQQIVASARINLATFDSEYKTNVTQLAQELGKSRPTVYGWADRAIIATIDSLRNIRTGRRLRKRGRGANASRVVRRYVCGDAQPIHRFRSLRRAVLHERNTYTNYLVSFVRSTMSN